MEKALVTVVLPIYNVERYLDRCVESVIHQTYSNLEILLVDDGSPDKCPEMCDEWAARDSRIRVIHKENAGLGEARNTGIEHATGDYICFFDSDDYIHPQTIEKSVTRLLRDRADVVIFGVNCVDADGKIKASYPPAVGEKTYRGEEVKNVFLPELIAPSVRKDGGKSFYMSAWVMLYSLEKIRSIPWRFASERNIISEDVYSLLSLFAYVATVSVIPEAFYFYCENGASLSRKYVTDRYLKIRHFHLETQALCKKLGYDAQIAHQAVKPYLAFTLAALKQETITDRPFQRRVRTIKEIIQDPVLQEALERIKRDKVSRTRAVMFWCMRHKLYLLCYYLLQAKS